MLKSDFTVSTYRFVANTPWKFKFSFPSQTPRGIVQPRKEFSQETRLELVRDVISFLEMIFVDRNSLAKGGGVGLLFL
jgi:hypothetical protein